MMNLTVRERDIVEFALYYLKANLDDVQSDVGARSSAASWTENEIDDVVEKLCDSLEEPSAESRSV